MITATLFYTFKLTKGFRQFLTYFSLLLANLVLIIIYNYTTIHIFLYIEAINKFNEISI